MKIFQSKSFEKKVKKISKNDKEELDKAIYAVIKNPEIGTEKKGDLVKIFVYKYKVKKPAILISLSLYRS